MKLHKSVATGAAFLVAWGASGVALADFPKPWQFGFQPAATPVMEDLANLIRKARIDLGVDIDLELSRLRKDRETNNTPQHFAVGTIRYPGNEPEGVLIYIKTCLTGKEPEDLLTYRRHNLQFPDESTGDQFFDEAQFESYRKLGELIAQQ